MRWDLIEKFEVLKKGRYAKAVKRFSGEEDFFREHFPGKPLVPEPFLIEMVAQAGGMLFGLDIDFRKEVVLAKIDRAEFPNAVAPPCFLEVEIFIEEEREEGAWIAGRVQNGKELVADVHLLLAAVDALVEGQKHIVFTEVLLKHFDVYHVLEMSEGLA